MSALVLLDAGTLALAVFAVLLFRIAFGGWSCRYGREALVCAAAYVAVAALVRVSVLMGLLSREGAQIVSGMSAAGFVTILANVMWAQRAWRHALDDTRARRGHS